MNNDQKEVLNTIDSKKNFSLLFFTSNKIDHAEQDFWIHSNILNVDKMCSVRITRTIQKQIHLIGSPGVSYLLLMMELNTISVFWVSFMQSVCVILNEEIKEITHCPIKTYICSTLQFAHHFMSKIWVDYKK